MLPWQADLVTDALCMDEAGGWTSYEVVELLARQNGKGVPIEALELFGLFVLRETRIVHSAHRFATSQEAFKRLIERPCAARIMRSELLMGRRGVSRG